jgi:hypothetical protein
MAANTVPFTLDKTWAGLGEVSGLLRDDGTHLCLQYQIQDAIVGAIKSGIKEVRIPLKDLISVTLTRGWLGNSWLGVKIVLQADRMDVFQNIPNSNPGRLELSISSKDRQAAEKLVDDLHEKDDKPSRSEQK